MYFVICIAFSSLFILNGALGCDEEEFDLQYTSRTPLTIQCLSGVLDTSAMPRLDAPTQYDFVTLEGCLPPPGASYTAALRALNVLPALYLNVNNLPQWPRLAPPAFDCLPASLQELTLKAASGVVTPSAEALRSLHQLRSVALYGVVPSGVPAHLDSLLVAYTDLTAPLAKPFEVAHLKIYEKNMVKIPGLWTKLVSLSASAPLQELPRAPFLQTLWLENTKVLPTELGVLYCDLVDLTLRQIQEASLKPRLLFRADKLVSFAAVRSSLASLPKDLFRYSPKLTLVDLSENRLTSFPQDLFSRLTALETLKLVGNHLSYRDALLPIANLTSLTTLQISNNPIGDLCEPDGVSVLSALANISTLDISGTRATRMCRDWTRLRRLAALRAADNGVRRVACAWLRVRRGASVDLRRNPLHRADCSEHDFVIAEAGPPSDKTTRVLLSSPLACDCGAYWLSKVLSLRDAPVRLLPAPAACKWPRCV